MKVFIALALFITGFGVLPNFVLASSPTTVSITQPLSGTVFNEGDIVTVSMVSTDANGVTPNPNWTLTSSIGGSFTTPTKSGNVWSDNWTTPIVTPNTNAVITADDGSSQASVTVSVIENCNPIIRSCGGIIATPINSTTTNPTSVPLYYFPVVMFFVFIPLMLVYLFRHRRHKKRPSGAKWSERF